MAFKASRPLVLLITSSGYNSVIFAAKESTAASSSRRPVSTQRVYPRVLKRSMKRPNPSYRREIGGTESGVGRSSKIFSFDFFCNDLYRLGLLIEEGAVVATLDFRAVSILSTALGCSPRAAASEVNVFRVEVQILNSLGTATKTWRWSVAGWLDHTVEIVFHEVKSLVFWGWYVPVDKSCSIMSRFTWTCEM